MQQITILGIDAAWSDTEPSGVALVQETESGWRCLRVAPSYEAFMRAGAVDWHKPSGGRADVQRLLESSAAIAGHEPDFICVDMPLSRKPITGRRPADDLVSKMYGAMLCSAHTPSTVRPGPRSDELRAALEKRGYPLATFNDRGLPRALLEVYPHPAIVVLLNLPQRLPYKVSKSNRYWPSTSLEVRRDNLLANMNQLLKKLEAAFGPVLIELPNSADILSLSQLKKYEDALDALVCCWVGTMYWADQACPLGDDTAAIWCPRLDTTKETSPLR